MTMESSNPALVTRLAYVITGDCQVDETSRAGLAGLTQVLSQRTALSPGEPIGIDLSRDEVAFYPLIYWPVVASRPMPSEAAIRRLDAFMKGGGTVIFDTRDAFGNRPDGAPTAEGQALRRMLASLDIPELEPVPADHVLTKTFYILDSFPGRYATGQTWVEALPPQPEGEENRPARSGDGVSPIIITSNDLAAAWAVGQRGEWLYPVVGSDQRQREILVSQRRQHRHVRADRQLQGRSGSRAGPARTARAIRGESFAFGQLLSPHSRLTPSGPSARSSRCWPSLP